MSHLSSFLQKMAIVPSSWIGVTMMTAVMLLVALTVHRMSMTVLTRLARTRAIPSIMLRAIHQPSRYMLVLFALQIAWQEVSPEFPLILWLRDMSGLALIGVLTWLGMHIVMAAGDIIIYLHPIEVADNLNARRIHTQVRVLTRIAMTIVGVIGLSSILMTFPAVHQIGATLLASAGVAGLVGGIAARPVLGNLIAGLQIALTQPVRLDDVVVVAGEWGRIEEITSSYIVVCIWDQRRLIVPLQWLIENPFQNWTRSTAHIIGSVFLWVDYRLPIEPLRTELARLCNTASEWDRRVQTLQVTDMNERAMQIRALVSSKDSSLNWDLRCKIREGLLEFIQNHYPDYLPRLRIHTHEQNGGSEK